MVDSTPYQFLIKPNTQSSSNHLRHSFFSISFQFLAIQIYLEQLVLSAVIKGRNPGHLLWLSTLDVTGDQCGKLLRLLKNLMTALR